MKCGLLILALALTGCAGAIRGNPQRDSGITYAESTFAAPSENAVEGAKGIIPGAVESAVKGAAKALIPTPFWGAR